MGWTTRYGTVHATTVEWTTMNGGVHVTTKEWTTRYSVVHATTKVRVGENLAMASSK